MAGILYSTSSGSFCYTPSPRRRLEEGLVNRKILILSDSLAALLAQIGSHILRGNIWALPSLNDPETVCRISEAVAKDDAKRWAREEHLKLWQLFTDHMFCKGTVDQLSQALTKRLLSLGRDNVRLAMPLLTRHGQFRKHLQSV